MALDGGFLTDKGPGGVPNWALGGLLILGLVAWSTFRKSTTPATGTTSTNPATSASQTPPNVFVLPGGAGQPAQPPAVGRDQSLPATAPYTVTGTTVPSDQWPGGVAIAAYRLSTSDQLDAAYYASLITLENPGLVAPYPVGTVLQIPINPNTTTHTSPYPNPTAA